jgi:uncharacterized damage-inducible protein DinB
MTLQPYQSLIRYKHWADHGLFRVVADNADRLSAEDTSILARIIDHFATVDRIFQHVLQGLPNPSQAPRSEALPELHQLIVAAREVDDWYVAYVAGLSAADLDDPIDFHFSNGTPARMTRGEILLHVCLHGTYHRGNAGILLQLKGIQPNDDRMTDFLEMAG